MERYFETLKVDPGASFDEVKKAYREQVKACHPDQFPDNFPRLQEKASERLRDINFAFQKLEKIFTERASATSAKNTVPPPPPRRRKTDAPSPQKPSSPQPDSSSKEYSAYEANRRKPSDHPRAAKQPLPPTPPVVSSVNGKTTLSFSNGDSYTGEAKGSQPHGCGAYDFAGGDRYIGEFVNGLPHGRGTFQFITVTAYEGDFVQQVMSGQGTYFSANGDQFTGGFQNGQPHGAGIHISKSGTQYHGQWEHGEMKEYRTVNPAN